ncbi:MAG TPA: hypothetical protein VNF68_02425, partial [Candidatus Baltobacteraceae bacterium]|nr:hypothetical protein [Candidatus Baltobacteraceae bacterium]
NAPAPSFRMPLHPWSTLFFLAFAWAIVADVLLRSPLETFFGMLVLLSGVPAYWLFSRKRSQEV